MCVHACVCVCVLQVEDVLTAEDKGVIELMDDTERERLALDPIYRLEQVCVCVFHISTCICMHNDTEREKIALYPVYRLDPYTLHTYTETHTHRQVGKLCID